MRSNRHTIGTGAAQTHALFPVIVNDEGGGLGPAPLKMRGGGYRPHLAETDVAR
jgi:hypothetical protein